MNSKGRLFRVLAWVVMIPMGVCLLGALALEALGMRVGPADGVYASASDIRPIATLLPGSSEPLPGTTVAIWFLNKPRFFAANEIFARDLSRGKTAEGKLAYHIQFDEAGFNAYLHYWFLPPGDELSQYLDGLHNPRVDLQPGGLSLLADVEVGGQLKPVGLLYQLAESQTQLVFVGIEYEDSVISTLPGSFLDEKVGAALERLANRALRELTFMDDSGAQLKISQIAIDEDEATVLATEPQ